MKRILSLDGGGIRRVFQASFLATIEDSIGDSVARYFDLIVGTSTGGILALGLGLGFPPARLLEFYIDWGPQVFRVRFLRRFLPRLFISKYEREPLDQALRTVFGTRSLGESKKRLVIPATNLESGEVYVFKTPHHPRFTSDHKVPVVDVALATAAAPTYFPTSRTATGTPLADGGIWANNPVGFGCVEAIGVLLWPKEGIKVLSIGTTAAALDIGAGRKMGLGMLYWGVKVNELFLAAQSSASLGAAELLVGKQNLKRVNPLVPPGRFGLDDVSEIPSLTGLGSSEARKVLPDIREAFFTEPATEFESQAPDAYERPVVKPSE